jgi:hypothetical protein
MSAKRRAAPPRRLPDDDDDVVVAATPRGDAPPPPRRPHFKLTVKTVVRPGATIASFRLVPPSAAGMPLSRRDGRYRATPLGLSARPVRESVHYSMEMSLKFREGEHRVTSELQNVFHADTDFDKIARKFVDFRGRLAKAYPYLKAVPSLAVQKTDAATGKFTFGLTLPPHTGFFTDDPHFWTVLRFNPASVKPHGATRYGITNHGSVGITYPTKEFTVNEFPDALYTVTNNDVAAPFQLGVTVEFFTDWLPQTLAEEKKLDRATAAEAFLQLMRNGLNLLNLDPRALVVDTASPDRMVLATPGYPGAGVKSAELHLRMHAPLREFFVLDYATIVFSFHEPRRLPLLRREPQAEDPLKDRYPVHLIALGQTGAHHHVDGQGWVSLLGLLSAPNKFAGRPESVEVSAEQTELRLRMVDRWCNPLIPTAPTEFVLYLELVDLF